MNSRALVEKTLNFDNPLQIPRQLWILPWAESHYPKESQDIMKRFPDDILSAPAIYKKNLVTIRNRYKIGEYVDEWGCKFLNVQDGVIGIVKEPIISNWAELEDFQPPESTLTLDKETVNKFCKGNDKFILSGSVVRPFERYQFLRTTEEAMVDLVLKPAGMTELLGMIHEHYCKEVEIWAQTNVDGIALMDDWGMQNSLLTSPEIFEFYFKPMYKEYANIASNYNKYVFMHSDGYITDIIEDLIEVGVHALNSQLFCMDIEELGEKFRGEITFWGEIDRQHLLPNGTKKDIEDAVRKVYKELYAGGGVIAQCEFGPAAKPENIFAVFETWDKISNSQINIRHTD
ncbi:uroporphyrinogen decarboxylase family protein [Bacteroidota bacterium]